MAARCGPSNPYEDLNMNFLCSLWPWLLPFLLGFLLCGWLARTFLRGRDLSGANAFKDTEINRLSSEVANLKGAPAKVVEKIIEKPVDRIVEKIVEKPVDRVVEKRIEVPVERVVEKVVEKAVDNPTHLSRIAALTAEVAVIAGLRSRIQQLEATPPKVVEKVVEKPVDRVVEKIVEKIVEKPVDRIVEKIVEKPVDRIVEKIVEKPVDRVVEKIVEKRVEVPVEKIVEKKVDNPALAARIVQLTAEVAVIAGLRGRIQQLESLPPKVVEKRVEVPVEKRVEVPVEKIVERRVEVPVEKRVEVPVQKIVEKIVEKRVEVPVDRIVEKRVEVPVEKIVEKRVEVPVEKIVEKRIEVPVEKIVEKRIEVPVDRVVEKLVQDTAGLADRDRQIADWRRRHGELEGEVGRLKADPTVDIAAAKREGVTVKGADDLEIIEGIGPKIAELLNKAGIRTFAELSRTPTSRIQSILDAAGPTFRVSNPGTWAEQADLCARNRWSTFKSLTDVLVAGVRVDGEAAKAEKAKDLSDAHKRVATLEAELQNVRKPAAINKQAAAASGFTVRGEDDLEIIEGIGPKIAELFHKAGVKTFAQLAAMTPEQCQPILDGGGANFKLADPGTWPDQADLAARNRWVALKAMQDGLTGGRQA
jgi:predicted flap endonuclease-1-like 5' DNA nuclease